MEVLILESDPNTIQELNTALKKLGHKVVYVTSSGEDVLEKAMDLNPHLILMDIQLWGKMNDINKIRTLNIPLIFLTVFYKNCLNKSLKLPEEANVLCKPIKEEYLEYCIQKSQLNKD